AHRSEHDVHTANGQCSAQLQRINPHTAHGIRGHQQLHTAYTSSITRMLASVSRTLTSNVPSVRSRSTQVPSAPHPQSSREQPISSRLLLRQSHSSKSRNVPPMLRQTAPPHVP